jgi:hypothetical protein
MAQAGARIFQRNAKAMSSSSNGRTSFALYHLCVLEDCHVLYLLLFVVFALLLAPPVYREAMYKVHREAIDFRLARFAQLAPLFHSSRLCDFVNAVLPASDFLLLVGTSQRGKKSVTLKHQANALPCSKRS